MNTKKESVLLFLGLVFALSIPIWVLGEIRPVELLPGLPISSLGAFTPGLAALILKYRDDRLAGFFQLLGRSFDFRRVPDKIWYLAFILINPAVAVLAYGALRISGKALPSPSLTIGIVPLFLVFFIAALGEEIGWTGYATEPLLRGWGGFATGIP